MSFQLRSVFSLLLIIALSLHNGVSCEDRDVEKEEKELKDRLGALEFQVGQLLGGNLAQARRSCSDWLRDGFTTSGHYLVDPDGLRGVSEFLVWCDMTVLPPLAVIHHDYEGRTLIDGFEEKGAYKIDITYASGGQHIAALMERSGPCRQEMKYECQGAIIHTSDNINAEPYAWWVGNGKEIKRYWPGGNPLLGGCACFKTKSCEGGMKCNCNKNDAVMRQDGGYVMDKSVLPITGIRAGDTGDRNERAYITVGPIQCEN